MSRDLTKDQGRFFQKRKSNPISAALPPPHNQQRDGLQKKAGTCSNMASSVMAHAHDQRYIIAISAGGAMRCII